MYRISPSTKMTVQALETVRHVHAVKQLYSSTTMVMKGIPTDLAKPLPSRESCCGRF